MVSPRDGPGRWEGGWRSERYGNSSGCRRKEDGKCKKKIARTGKKVTLYFAMCSDDQIESQF